MEEKPSLTRAYDDLFFCKSQISALYALMIQTGRDGIELSGEDVNGLCKILEHIHDEIERIQKEIDLADEHYRKLKEKLKKYESASIAVIKGGNRNECACNRA